MAEIRCRVCNRMVASVVRGLPGSEVVLECKCPKCTNLYYRVIISVDERGGVLVSRRETVDSMERPQS